MAILNYTTKVEASKSIGEIQSTLAKFGARSISTDYDDKGQVSGLSFVIMLEGLPVRFQMPANVSGVLEAMKLSRVERRFQNDDQARRVAWRILKDWIEAQLAIVQAKQAQTAEVFLPYAVDQSGRTFFSLFVMNHRKQLSAGTPTAGDLES